MIKKWSYVAAIMLTAASGLSLTSCIDNDEPYGIEQIRIATASLLEAKKSAVNAEQAANEAKIEIAKIEAEIKKLEAENQKILNEAQAKIAEAEAEAIKLRAEAEKAVSDAEAQRLLAEAARLQALADEKKAEIDMYILDQQAKIDEYIAQAKIRVDKAQLEYETSLYYFQQEQAKNADKANTRLYKAWETAFEAYIEQLGVVNTLTSCYLQAVENYNKAAVDLELVTDEKGNPILSDGKYQWKSKNYSALASLEKAVKDAQENIDKANKEIAKYQEIIANLQNVTKSELYDLFERYEKEAKTNDAELLQAEVELATLPVENKELKQSIDDLTEQVKAFENKDIEITPYTWDPATINDGKDVEAFASIGITEPEVIVPERTDNKKTAYTLANADQKDKPYLKAVNAYKSQINELKNYLLDANDVEWTNARINEMKRIQTEQNVAFGKAEKKWQNAKDVYNRGNEPKYDLIPEETNVVKAIAAYNTAGTSFEGLRQTYLEALEASKKANELVYELTGQYPATRANDTQAASTFKTAYDKYYKDLADNQVAYDKAIKDAENDYNKAVAEASTEYQNAVRDQAAKQAAYDAILKANNNDKTADAVVAAEAELNTAKDTTKAKKEANEKAPANALKVQQQANLEATNAKRQADADALNTYSSALTAFENAAGKDASKELLSALTDAENKLGDLKDAEANYNDKVTAGVQDKFDELTALCAKQSDEVGGWNLIPLAEITAKLAYFLDVDGNLTNEELKELKFPKVEEAPSHYAAGAYSVPDDMDSFQVADLPSNVMKYLINTSQTAFGMLGYNDPDNSENRYDPQDPDNRPWDVDQAFLVDKVTLEMVNEYIKEMYPKLSEFNYYTHYDLFGLYGKTLYTENRINVATAMVENQNLLSESIKPLQEGLDALEEGKEAKKKELNELKYQLNDKEAEWNKLEAGYLAKVNNLNNWKVIYNTLLSNLTDIIAYVEENVDTKDDPINGLINEYIKNTIESYEKKIENLQKKIDGEYKDTLDKAQYQLDQYVNNEGVMTANPEEINLAMATAVLNAAQEKLAFLKARADELEAKYKAANQ